MKKAFEEKFLTMIEFDIRKISNCEENSITKNYYDCYNYLCDIINTLGDTASDWLITELCIQKQFYQYRYLYNKGLL